MVNPNRSFIEESLKAIQREYDSLTKEHAFAMWVLSEYHFPGELDLATLEDIFQLSHQLLLEGGEPGDKKLDGFYYDDETNTLYLYQAKYPEDPSKRMSMDDAREVGIALAVLYSDLRELESLPDSRRQAATHLQKVIDSSGSIVLRNVCAAQWGQSHHNAVRALIPKKLRGLTRVELEGLAELQRLQSERTKDLSGIWEEIDLFAQTDDPILYLKNRGVRGFGDAYVVLTSAHSVASLTKKHGVRLFDKNVRLFLGGGGRNKDIRESLENEEDGPKCFWYGHNGITILTNEIKLVPDAREPERLRLRNPQIVNGCQTANTIKDFFFPQTGQGRSPEDFALLARVITIEGTDEVRRRAAEQIAFCTNNQKAVQNSDLRANDSHQKFYQLMLRQHKWFYERRQGEWKSLSPHEKARFKASKNNDRMFGKDVYQQAWRAYAGDPMSAIVDKSIIWDRQATKGNLLYETVFDRNRRWVDIVLAITLYQWFEGLFTLRKNKAPAFELHKGLRKSSLHFKRCKMLVAAHSVALVGHAIRDAFGALENYPEVYAKQLIDKLPRGSRYVRHYWKQYKTLERPFKIIMSVWAGQVNLIEELQKKQVQETLYQRLRNQATFKELCEAMDRHAEDPYKDMLTPK